MPLNNHFLWGFVLNIWLRVMTIRHDESKIILVWHEFLYLPRRGLKSRPHAKTQYSVSWKSSCNEPTPFSFLKKKSPCTQRGEPKPKWYFMPNWFLICISNHLLQNDTALSSLSSPLSPRWMHEPFWVGFVKTSNKANISFGKEWFAIGVLPSPDCLLKLVLTIPLKRNDSVSSMYTHTSASLSR